MTILFFDMETTGTNPELHGIHQISGAFVVDGNIAETFNYHVKPRKGCQCDPYAMQMAGHTYEEMMASNEYRPMKEVFDELLEKIVRYDGGILKDNHPDYNRRIFAGGYNIHKFDMEFLRRWFTDNGAPYGIGYYIAEAIDVMLLAVPALMRWRSKMPGFTQEEIAWALGVKIDSEKLHDADYDITVCVEIYRRRVTLGRVRMLPQSVWDEMHSPQEVKEFKESMIAKRREKKAAIQAASQPNGQ